MGVVSNPSKYNCPALQTSACLALAKYMLIRYLSPLFPLSLPLPLSLLPLSKSLPCSVVHLQAHNSLTADVLFSFVPAVLIFVRNMFSSCSLCWRNHLLSVSGQTRSSLHQIWPAGFPICWSLGLPTSMLGWADLHFY